MDYVEVDQTFDGQDFPMSASLPQQTVVGVQDRYSMYVWLCCTLPQTPTQFVIIVSSPDSGNW